MQLGRVPCLVPAGGVHSSACWGFTDTEKPLDMETVSGVGG